MCIPPTCGRLGGRRARAPLWVVRSDCAGLQGSRGGCSGLTADTHARQNGHTRERENGGRGRSRTQDARQGTRRIVGARGFHCSCSHKREQSCVLVQLPSGVHTHEKSHVSPQPQTGGEPWGT